MTNEARNRLRPKTEKPNTLRYSLRCLWADIMVRYMKESTDYCTFHFSRHYIAKANCLKHNIPVVFYAIEKYECIVFFIDQQVNFLKRRKPMTIYCSFVLAKVLPFLKDIVP